LKKSCKIAAASGTPPSDPCVTKQLYSDFGCYPHLLI